ncbi:MAG TPA: histidine phosphatase family protein, partial [Planctomycetota bacterium]|nr:histidine phosphatase family protein [Planctomycetota bacterium]
LAAEGVTHIWSSPFRRAIHTASFLAKATGVEVVLEPDMVEHYIFDDLEGYPGRTGDQLKQEFGCVWVPDGMDRAWTPAFPESWEQLLERTQRVAERALELGRESDDVHLVVFGHGASTKALVTALIGDAIPPDAPFVNAGMSRARLDGALPGRMVFLNDASHLAVLRDEGT